MRCRTQVPCQRPAARAAPAPGEARCRTPAGRVAAKERFEVAAEIPWRGTRSQEPRGFARRPGRDLAAGDGTASRAGIRSGPGRSQAGRAYRPGNPVRFRMSDVRKRTSAASAADSVGPPGTRCMARPRAWVGDREGWPPMPARKPAARRRGDNRDRGRRPWLRRAGHRSWRRAGSRTRVMRRSSPARLTARVRGNTRLCRPIPPRRRAA
jgi:hypothetical protein